MERLIGHKPVRRGKLAFTTSLSEMAAAADFIQEAAPEREDLKIRLFREIGEAARADVVIASSSSGFLPSRLQSQCPHPERVLIGHPFNPVYLLPLVELVPGKETSDRFMDDAAAFYTGSACMCCGSRRKSQATSATVFRRRCGARRCTASTRTSARPAISTMR
jgi:carnitine 3-dehydrogenase